MSTTPVNGSFTVDGNNVIQTSQSGITAGYLQFSLATSDNITWWKGIKIFDGKNNMICLLATQDQDHGPDTSKQFNLGAFDDEIRVEIWKAKAFGVHTPMATVNFKTSDCNGKNTLLYWKND